MSHYQSQLQCTILQLLNVTETIKQNHNFFSLLFLQKLKRSSICNRSLHRNYDLSCKSVFKRILIDIKVNKLRKLIILCIAHEIPLHPTTHSCYLYNFSMVFIENRQGLPIKSPIKLPIKSNIKHQEKTTGLLL